MRCLRSSADINGEPPREYQRVRAGLSRLLVAKLNLWLQAHQAKLFTHIDTGKAIRHSLNRRSRLVRFLADGRLCVTNNGAQRALRCVVVGRHNWTFAGTDEDGRWLSPDAHITAKPAPKRYSDAPVWRRMIIIWRSGLKEAGTKS
jgi:hypothetical protein